MPDDLLGFASLAAAVISQALKDSTRASVPAVVRQQARAFLHGDGLTTWCMFAGADPERIRHALSHPPRLRVLTPTDADDDD